MGVHTLAELNHILANFDLAKKNYAFCPMNDGFINDTYLVSDNNTPCYILQRINQDVFKNVTGLMGNIDHALKQLSGNGYEKIELIRTTSGTSFLSDASGNWRVMTYINNSTAHNTTTVPKVAFEAGRIIGKFHLLLKNTNTNDFVDTIAQFHDLDLRERQFNEAFSNAAAAKLEIAKTAISFSRRMLGQLKELQAINLPIRICHNDTKLNNILFSKKTNTALCLIDLDTLMKGYFHYDFGDAIRTIVNTAPEDEQEHTKITFEKDLFVAFTEGLAANAPFLTQKEIDNLPLGAIVMPFLHGIRALTDYLNNNIYYKVAYENQNLDRCLSLFDFTQKAYDELNYMKQTVSSLLKPL